MPRFQTFANGDVITPEFLNEWVQDKIVEMEEDLFALDDRVEVQGTTLTDHQSLDVDPHGSVVTYTGEVSAPVFRYTGLPRTAVVDAADLCPLLGASFDRFSDGTYAGAQDVASHFGEARIPVKPGDTIKDIRLDGFRDHAAVKVEAKIYRKTGGLNPTSTLFTTLTLIGTGGYEVRSFITDTVVGAGEVFTALIELNNADLVPGTQARFTRLEVDYVPDVL